jgi:hypothetical protein
MHRVKKSSIKLHYFNTENKSHSWNETILAAQLELRRVENRAMQLRGLIETYRSREQSRDPFIGSGEINFTGNIEISVATLQMHSNTKLEHR